MYISSKAIIGSIIRDFGINSTTFNNDIIEWIGESIEAIGSQIYGYEIKYLKADVVDYKIPIPCEAVEIFNIFHNCIPLKKGFKKSKKDYSVAGLDFLRTEFVQRLNANEISCKLKFCEPIKTCCDIEDKETLIDEILNKTEEIRKEYLNFNKCFSYNEKQYEITPHCIKTNIESGNVIIQYLSFAKDEEGYPMIYDSYKYREAIKYFCIFKLLQRGVKHPVLQYQDLYQMWIKHKIQAENESKILNTIQLDNFTEKWTNSIISSNSIY